jgi:F-type H+-transporting ATPase subunit epsilon
MTAIHVEVVTPDGIRFEGKVDACTVPGFEGEFQVLGDHAGLIGQLLIGQIRLAAGGKTTRLSTSGGFIEVGKNNVNIIAEAAELADDIEIDRAKRAEERARSRMKEAKDIDIERAKLALARAVNRLKVDSKS